MAVLQGYNLINEGNAYNSVGVESSFERVVLDSAAITSLYSGSVEPATTITGSVAAGGSYFSVDVVFGETYTAHTLRYSQNLTTLSGVAVTYGVDSPTDFSAPLTLASGTIETAPLGDVRFVRLTHSCSPGVVVEPSQVIVLGVENELIGYGQGPSEQYKALFNPSSPVGEVGSSYLEVPVYNRHNGPIDINIAVKPTGSYRDRYLRVGVTSSGTFYGINEYGVGTTPTEILSISDDNFVGSSLADLSAEWEPLYNNTQCFISPSSEGLVINTSSTYGFGEVSYAGSTSFAGIVSRDSFSSNQSFTLRARVRATSLNNTGGGSLDVVIGFSSGPPARSESYNVNYPYVDEFSPAGAVRAGVSLGWSAGTLVGVVDFNWGDGTSYANYRLSARDGTLQLTDTIAWGWLDIGSVSNADLSYAVNGGASSNPDGTANAEFRELILTWDHVDRLVEGYIDKIKIGSYRMKVPPSSGCRFFMGVDSNAGPNISVVITDFSVDTTALYRQARLTSANGVNSASSLTALDTIDHPASKLISPDYPHYDYTLGSTLTTSADDCWSTDDPPATYEAVTLDFDESDVVAVEVYTPTYLTSTTFGGVPETASFGLLPRSALIAVGDVTKAVELPNTLGRRTILATTASGATSLTVSFFDYHTYTPSVSHTSAILSNVVPVVEYTQAITAFPAVPQPKLVPWTSGVFKNMKAQSSSAAWTIARTDVVELARVNDTEGLYKGVDYDVANAFSYTDSGYVVPASANPQVIFRARDDDEDSTFNLSGSWHWYGHPVWVWRRFAQLSRLKAVQFAWGSSQNAHAEQGYINKFKIQYLVPGLHPSDETSWADIPPVSVPWPYGGDFATYKQWFIDNNDGEYYTGTAFAFPGDTGMPASYFLVPDEATALKDYRWEHWALLEAGSINNEIYLELDEAIETEAVRLVIAESLDNTRTTTTDLMNLVRFAAFSDTAYATYTSPVFDTGTANNTERLDAALTLGTTSSGIVYTRSSAVAPTWPKNIRALTWQPWQVPLYGSIYDSAAGGDASGAISVLSSWPHVGVVNGSRVYIIPVSSTYYPVYYDYSTGSWGTIAKLGPQVDNARADSRVTNNAVVLSDGNLYVAVRYGDANDARIMRYDFEPDEYNISGWRHLGVNRPVEAITSSMVGYGQKLYFFCSDGTTIEFDVDSSSWDPTLPATPLHGLPYRKDAWPVVIGSKVFLVAGRYYDVCPYIDEFDLETKTWGRSHRLVVYPTLVSQAVAQGSKIYILPRGNSYQNEPGYTIFDTETWEAEYDDFYRLAISRFLVNRFVFELCGTSWVYEGVLYSFQSGYGGNGVSIKQCQLDRGAWEPGQLPAQYDKHWGAGAVDSLEWVPASSYGELLPQERYFQFKVDFSEASTSGTLVPPVLNKTTVVLPQQLPRVPTSGTSSFYLKLGVSADDAYRGWYSSNAVEASFSGYYSTVYNTNFGTSFVPTDCSRAFVNPAFPWYALSRESYFDPCVLLDEGTYKMWFYTATSYVSNTVAGTTSSGQLSYSTSSDGVTWASPVTTLSYDLTTLSGACGAAVYSPCVIKESPAEFKMWYSCQDLAGTSRILLSTSVNGVSWGAAELSQGVGTSGLSGQADALGADKPWVLNTGTEYRMWYVGHDPSGHTSIVTCASVSGTLWGSHKVAIARGFSGPYDAAGVSSPSVVFDVGEFNMWYVGTDYSGTTRTLHTTSADGVSWSTPSLAISPGLSGYDVAGLGRLSVLVNRIDENYNEYFTGLSVKIHD